MSDTGLRDPRTLRLDLDLPSLSALVVPPDIDAFSPAYRPYSYTSGLGYVADRLYGDLRIEKVEATFNVPAEEISASTAEDTRQAIGRWSEAKIEEASPDVRAAVIRGRRALIIGAVAMVVLVSLAQVVRSIGDAGIWESLATGLEIAAWVSLWFPIEKIAWDGWERRNDRKVFERVRAMDFELKAASA